MSEDTSFDFIYQLDAIRQNDEKTLESIYKFNYPSVEQFVLANNGTVDEAKDIYQEAFITMWRNIKLDQFKPINANSIHAYLFRIARNKWIDHLRMVKKNKTVRLGGISEADDTEEVYSLPPETDQQLSLVRASFLQLGEGCRELLKRFYFLKQSLKEIAAGREWTEATAKNNKYRCLQQLRKLVNSKNSNYE